MKTLIIAAGNGTRLREYTKSIPKPLVLLNEKSLIEIIIGKCKNLGLNDFIIVTGYLEEKLKRDVNKMGINVEFISNPDFDKENGISVYCARNSLKNENTFLLLMTDHIFDSNLLNVLLDYKMSTGCTLAIDKEISKVLDLKDATKVYHNNGKILNIDKNLNNYNAIDTGFFLCTQDIFVALKQSIENGRYKLSDAMKLLAKNNELSAVDVTGNFWLDIDTAMDIEFARKKLHLMN